MDEKQLEKIFKYIEGQFQNALIHCEVKKELTNWYIMVTAIVDMPGGKSYVVSRRSEDLSERTNYNVAVAIYSLVHVLRHALCHYVFVNPKAPEELEL